MFKNLKDSYGDFTPKGWFIIVSTCVIILFGLIILFSSFAIINAGEVGIKTEFGKIKGSQMNEGLHFVNPLTQNVTKISIKVKKYDSVGNGASKDLQDVSINAAINYSVDYTKAIELFRTVGKAYEETILAPAIQESIKSISANYTAEELITKRQEVSIKMQEKLSEKVLKYGLRIDNFNITNFQFSPEFNKAIEEKQIAEQKVATAKNNLLKAEIDAKQKIVEAEASARANQLMQQTLTDNLIKQQFIQKWDGKLPVVTSEGNILDISELVK